MTENVTPPAVQAVANGKKQSGVQWLTAAILIAAMCLALVWVRTDMNANQLEDIRQSFVITTLSQDSQRLRDELTKKGINPDTIAPSPEKRTTGTNQTPGPQGKAGVGIARAAVTNGHLVVFYTDGSSQSVGVVVGPAGASITGAPGIKGDKGASVTGAPGIPGLSITGADGKGGAPGVDGKNGVDGAPGAPGAPGPASIIPGPAGPIGPEGPVCAVGFKPALLTFTTTARINETLTVCAIRP